MKKLLCAGLICLSCSTQTETKQAVSVQEATTQKSIPADTINAFISYRDTATIGGVLYTGLCDTNYRFCLLNQKLDTVFVKEELSPMFTFIDFNGDGLKDIIFDYHTNVPSIHDLVLFDQRTKTFRFVEGFNDYPAAVPLKNKQYYYSYHRSGCADMNWDSDLFYIKNFETHRIGAISGRECGDEGIKDGIYIYKVNGDKETLMNTLSIETIRQYKEYKWGFIEEYWNLNLRKFIAR